MKKMLVYNDDGWSSLMRYPAPASVEQILEHTVGLVEGTGVDIYQMCLLTGNVSIYDSRVLERYASQLEKPYRMYMWRTVENIKSLDVQGTDLLEIVVRGCHARGMEAHASLRMNDKHHTFKLTGDSLLLSRQAGRSDYVFPDLRSDWIEKRPGICLEDGSLDFFFEEARQYRLDTIREILDNYDVDGIDLDFTRFPPFFRDSQKIENTGLITDMVQKVCCMVQEQSRKSGKKIKLTARVEYDLEANIAEGLDIFSWIKNEYLDILYLGVVADCTPDAPIDEYIRMCAGTKCKVCPSIEGQFYWVGGMNRMGPVRIPSIEMARAFAQNSYESGAAGLQLFNFCCADEPWDRRILTDLPYPEQILHQDKLYYFTMAPSRISSLTCRWESKLTMHAHENEANYLFYVSEDIPDAMIHPMRPSLRFMMRIMGLNRRDDAAFQINNHEIFPDADTENHWDWDGWSDILYFTCNPDDVHKGRNLLQMIRKANHENYIGDIEIIELELQIQYPKENVIGNI